MLVEQCGGTCIGCVHMKPEIVAAGDLSDLGYGINAGSGRGADRRDDAKRLPSAGKIVLDQNCQRIGTHAELVIGRNMPNVIEANACGQSAAINR